MTARIIFALLISATLTGALGVYLLAGPGPTLLFIAACAFYLARALAKGSPADGSN